MSEIKYTFVNQIMFALVMQNKDICAGLLNRIFPEREVSQIRFPDEEYLETEKTIIPGIASKSVRYDVLFENDYGWHDIEMQVALEKDLPKRCRYYHSVMDVAHLHKGQPYKDLTPAYVIFICPFDYYQVDEPVLYFESMERNLHLPLGDDSVTIILNTICNEEKIPSELKPLFNYINNGEIGTIEDELVKNIDQMVKELNSNKEVRQIMDMETAHMMREELARRDGLAEGLEKGAETARRETAQKMKAKGIPAEIIIECTGLTEKEIEEL